MVEIPLELKRIDAIYYADPTAKIRHWWGRLFPDVEFSSHRLENFLIAECGLSSIDVKKMLLIDVAEILVARGKSLDNGSPDWQEDTLRGWAAYFKVTGRTITTWANKFHDWIKLANGSSRGRYQVDVNHPEVIARRTVATRDNRK